MRVYLNDEEMDVHLQEEQTASEVIAALHRFLTQGHFGLSKVLINENDILYSHGWETILIKDIKKISLSASPCSTMRQESLTTILAWCQAAYEISSAYLAKKASNSEILGLFSKYPSLDPYFNFLCEFDPSPTRMLDREHRSTLNFHIGNCTKENGTFNPEAVAAFSSCVQGLVTLCKDRLKELLQPVKEARSTAQLALKLLGGIKDAGILLQTNQEKEAFNSIYAFSEVLSKLLRLFWIMTEQGDADGTKHAVPDLKAWNNDAELCFSNILEAMSTQDTVMLGDLLEYELPPLVEKLTGFVPAAGA